MIDPARLRQEAAGLRAAADRLDAIAASLAPVTPPRPVPPAVAHPQPSGAGLGDPAAFFAYLKRSSVFGKGLTTAQVQGCERLMAVGAGRLPLSWMASVLGQVYHETGHTMEPVKERGSHAYLDQYDTGEKAARLGNTPEDDDDGQLYAGRGDIQITGRRNYRFATQRLRELGFLTMAQDLEKTPELALEPRISAAIAVFGCLEGWFTGKSLQTYLQSPATEKQFQNARRVVNGTDKAAVIAAYCVIFQAALQAGRWM